MVNSKESWSLLQYLRIQDMARKRRVNEVPWAKGVYSTDHGKISKTVTKEKLKKGNRQI